MRKFLNKCACFNLMKSKNENKPLKEKIMGTFKKAMFEKWHEEQKKEEEERERKEYREALE